jgi:hypothetical protein
MKTSNFYFEKFGHYCALNKDGDVINRLQRWTTVDPTSKLSLLHFNSHSAIINERKFHIENHPLIIHPFSSFKMLWEILMILALLICLVYDPLQYLHLLNPKCSHVDWSFINIVCVIDIFLRFRMGYWDENNFKASIFFIGTMPISYFNMKSHIN